MHRSAVSVTPPGCIFHKCFSPKPTRLSAPGCCRFETGCPGWSSPDAGTAGRSPCIARCRPPSPDQGQRAQQCRAAPTRSCRSSNGRTAGIESFRLSPAARCMRLPNPSILSCLISRVAGIGGFSRVDDSACPVDSRSPLPRFLTPPFVIYWV
jgi:hypothetical protein